jgi:hypothetical protein
LITVLEKKSNASNLRQFEIYVNVSRRVITIGHCTDTGITVHKAQIEKLKKNAQQPGPANKKGGRTMCSRKESG